MWAKSPKKQSVRVYFGTVFCVPNYTLSLFEAYVISYVMDTRAVSFISKEFFFSLFYLYKPFFIRTECARFLIEMIGCRKRLRNQSCAISKLYNQLCFERGGGALREDIIFQWERVGEYQRWIDSSASIYCDYRVIAPVGTNV